MSSKIMQQLALLTATAVLTFGTTNASAGHHEEKAMTQNIVATAQSAGQFETLIAAASAAGLADVLANDGPFTVFAPTDAAFAALPDGTVASLLEPANKDKLARILKFHVLAGKVGSGALADGISVDTLANAPAGIAASEGGFTIEGASIVATDIEASNGVIHVIDRVILPPETMSAVRPARAVIDRAIEAGVPMFNHGNADATAAIYRTAAENLLLFSNAADLSKVAVMRLEQGLKRADAQSDARSQAWTLRYALDDVRSELVNEPMQAMAAN
ncbi:MAG: fasciclin domain-containing protein [Woeseiaceae bacterium]